MTTTDNTRRPPPIIHDEHFDTTVRDWLGAAAVRREVIGLDDDLAAYPNYADGGEFLGRVEDLVMHASRAGILAAAGVRVYFTVVADPSGVLDGGIVSVDYQPDPGGPAARFSSGSLDHDDLIGDTDLAGMDAAVSILRTVAGEADVALAAAAAVFAPPPVVTAEELVAGLGAFGVDRVRLVADAATPASWMAQANVTYRQAGMIDSAQMFAYGDGPRAAVRELDRAVRARFVPGSVDVDGHPCAVLRSVTAR